MGKIFFNAKVFPIGQRDADKAKVLSLGKLKLPHESAFARENYDSHRYVRSLGERDISFIQLQSGDDQHMKDRLKALANDK